MRTVLFIPPLRQMSGGLASIYAIAEDLCSLGHEIALSCPGEAPGLSDLLRQGNITRLPWEGISLAKSDLWVVPESWPNAISPGVNSGARTLVYAQSWNFFLTTLPAGVRWKQLPVHFLAVSRPVAWFMEKVLELSVLGVLPPAVNPVFSGPEGEGGRAAPRPGVAPENQRGNKNIVRVGWMPRKNRALADQVRQVAETALERLERPVRVEWVPLQNMTQAELAAALSTCPLFLSTAFPEGFGLTVVEAMAAGCVPVGFTGFGGWEYMRQAALLSQPAASAASQSSATAVSATPQAFVPAAPAALWLHLPAVPAAPQPGLYETSFSPALRASVEFLLPPDKPEGGNGLYFHDGDVLGAGLGLAHAIELADKGGPVWEQLRANAGVSAEFYSVAARRWRLESIWPALTGAEPLQSLVP